MRTHWPPSLPGQSGHAPESYNTTVDQESLAHLLAASLAALLMAIALLVATPGTAAAFELRTGDGIDVPAGETVQDDLYAFGQRIEVAGTVDGDVIAGAAETTISGVVTGDLIAAAGTIVVTGQVNGSVRASGGTIRVEGTVGEDLIVAGGDVSIGGSGRVGRDALFGAGTTTIDGAVARNVLAGAGQVIINGTVGGDVQAQAETVTLGPGAVVGGALTYTSKRPAEISSSATVSGPVQHQVPEPAAEQSPLLDAAVGWLRTMVGVSALGLLLVLLLPGFGDRASETVQRVPWLSLGLGLTLLVAWPLVALLVFGIGLAIGGWWLGLLLLALYALALLFGYVVSGLLVGRLTLARLGPPDARILAVVVGLAILTLAGLIPFVGWAVTLVSVWSGSGRWCWQPPAPTALRHGLLPRRPSAATLPG